MADPGRLPTSGTVTFDFGVPVSPDSVSVSSDGEITFFKDGSPLRPIAVTAGAHRPRGSKEKKLFELPTPALSSRIGELPNLLRYRQVFVIDTNTKRFGHDLVSISAIIVCTIAHDAIAQNLLIQSLLIGGFEFRNCKIDPEKFGWAALVRSMETSPDFDLKAQYLLVTDHDLRSHAGLNRGELAYHPGKKLPSQIQVAFATSDSGDFYLQKSIRLCDRAAAKALRDLGPADASSYAVNHALVSHFRVIQNTGVVSDPRFRGFRLSMDCLPNVRP